MAKSKVNPADLEAYLRDAITASGLSINELGRRAGVAPAVICRFINRDRTITIETASRLAVVLGLQFTGGKRSRKG